MLLHLFDSRSFQKTIFLRIQETKQPSLNPLQNRVSPSWDPI